MPKQTLKIEPAIKQKVVPTIVTSAKLEALCEERLAVGVKLSQLEPRKKELDADILQIANKRNPDGALDVNEEFAVRRTDASNRYLDPAKLMAAGVKASIIEKCWTKTDYSYVRVTRIKKDAQGAQKGRKR